MTGPSYSMWQLVKYMLGLVTRGGGPVALAGYMYRDLVEKRQWISEADCKRALPAPGSARSQARWPAGPPSGQTSASRWPCLPPAIGGVQRAEPDEHEEGRRHEGETDRGPLSRHAAILAIFASMCAAGTALAEDWRTLEGPAIRRAFSEREYGDGAHYAHRFLRDGSLEGTEMGRTVQGRWRVEGKQLCTDRTEPRTSKQCFEVERSGDEVRLLSNGYAVFNGRLSPIARSRSPARR